MVSQKSFNELKEILLYIVNKSLQDSDFPTLLKYAAIRLTNTIKDKNEDTELYSNYRPITISNTPFVSKLLEKAAHSQINNYINEDNMHALPKIVNDIQCNISCGKTVALILLDLSAALDTVDHDILSDKVKHNFNIKKRF